MIAFSAISLLLIAGLAIFPMLALQKRQRAAWWDWVYPFTGVLTWFPLAISNIRSTVSLSNFVVEVFWIAVLSIAVPWARWLMSKAERKEVMALSSALTLLPMLAAMVLRLTMPTLAE